MPASTTKPRSRKGATKSGSKSSRKGATTKKATSRKSTGTDKALAAKQKKAAEAKAKAAAERKAAREAKDAEKAAERQAAIKSGDLVVDGDAEFHVTDGELDGAVEVRAAAVVDALKASKVPVLGRDLQEQFEGGWPQYLSFFSLLKVQGLVREYRKRTGDRSGSGVAYLWIGK